MSRARRKKRKPKSREIAAEPDPIAEPTMETEEPVRMSDVDAIEAILDNLETKPDSLTETAPPQPSSPSVDLQEPTSEDISGPSIRPAKPTKLREPYRFPELPRHVDAEPRARDVHKKPISIPTKLESKREKVKPKLKVKSWTEFSKKERARILAYEGELYASVATLNFLTMEFTEYATVPPAKYRRYLRSLLRSIENAQHSLEQLGLGVHDFVKREELEQRFPKGTEILEKHLQGILVIPSYDLTQLPRKSAKFVGTCIELIDLLRLGELARVELLLPLLEDLARVLESISFIGGGYWSVKDIREWIKTLELERPETILSESLARKLELQADRWLRDFKGQLSNL